MILADIRHYLKQQRRVALKDLALHFNTDTEALKGMLELWISKGQVKKLPSGTSCGSGCCQCDPSSIEIYEWVGK